MASRVSIPLMVAAGLCLSHCGNNESDKAVQKVIVAGTPVSGSNVLSIQVGGGMSVCGSASYPNEPCTSVTLCQVGTSTCQTISDILVDTGSVGLRVFSSAISLSLTNIVDGSSNTLAQCAQFGSGSTWGPMATADVVLGGESAVTMPIQLINSSFKTVPGSCNFHLETSPSFAGFNGILGVGQFREDCGTTCAVSNSNGMYFACPSASSTCSGTTVAVANQVPNPVHKLPVNNNGVIVAMPSVPDTGAWKVTGSLILGVGTQTNNQPLGTETVYLSNSTGNFTTTFNSTTFTNQAFTDTGSNALFFPAAVGPATCSAGSIAPGFFCPTSTQSNTATVAGSSGGSSGSVSFKIANAVSLLNNGDTAFHNLGGTMNTYFDWGLPFFFGRTVTVVIQGKTATGLTGTGPYIAF
ncbi:DUF3443 domain-containing protein [bacterium]|nr:DUF3443 domain-containing protein [bacterium]